jgi:hypothetical protein
MRCALFVAMFALLFGVGGFDASVLAQETPGTPPTSKQTDGKPAKKHVRRSGATAKPADAKSSRAGAVARQQADTTSPAAKPNTAIKAPGAHKAAAAKSAAGKPEPARSETGIPDPPPDVFAGIPLGERLKIQAALLWTGDYTGAGGGDDPMLTAVRNYQKRTKAKVTGVLTPPERAALVAAAKAQEDEFGWSVVVDPATGIRIGLPTKLVPQVRDASRGTRWSSAHGEVQVETFRIKDAALKLAALFEREKKEPVTRKIARSALHDDDFFISGMQGLKNFSVRARLRDGEVRGFTVLYDQAMEGIVAPAMVAMASAFSPFPEHSAPYAVPAKPVEYGTGLVVSAQGHFVTDLRLTEGCKVIVAAGLGDADRVAADKDNRLALLRVYGTRKLSPLSLGRDAAAAGKRSRELRLVGIPDPKEQDGSRGLTEVRAQSADGAAIELREPVPMAGFSGAAALDAQGRFLGMMEMGHAVLASVEPTAPPVRLVSAETIRGFLAAHHVPTAQAQNTDARASVVRVICVRK